MKLESLFVPDSARRRAQPVCCNSGEKEGEKPINDTLSRAKPGNRQPPQSPLADIEGQFRQSLPGVRPHQLDLVQDVPIHRLEQLLLGRTGRQVKHRVQRVELEEIPVGAAGWTGAAVAQSSPTVLAVPAAIGQVGVRRDTFRQGKCSNRDIIEHPMDLSAHRRVGIVRYEGETLRILRGISPLQGR